MKRGSLVLIALPGDYGKPRPGLVIQSDLFASHPSIVVLPLTTEDRSHPGLRVDVVPAPGNGLRAPSRIMIDKPSTVPRGKVTQVIGQLTAEQMTAVDRALALFLGVV